MSNQYLDEDYRDKLKEIMGKTGVQPGDISPNKDRVSNPNIPVHDPATCPDCFADAERGKVEQGNPVIAAIYAMHRAIQVGGSKLERETGLQAILDAYRTELARKNEYHAQVYDEGFRAGTQARQQQVQEQSSLLKDLEAEVLRLREEKDRQRETITRYQERDKQLEQASPESLQTAYHTAVESLHDISHSLEQTGNYVYQLYTLAHLLISQQQERAKYFIGRTSELKAERQSLRDLNRNDAAVIQEQREYIEKLEEQLITQATAPAEPLSFDAAMGKAIDLLMQAHQAEVEAQYAKGKEDGNPFTAFANAFANLGRMQEYKAPSEEDIREAVRKVRDEDKQPPFERLAAARKAAMVALHTSDVVDADIPKIEAGIDNLFDTAEFISTEQYQQGYKDGYQAAEPEDGACFTEGCSETNPDCCCYQDEPGEDLEIITMTAAELEQAEEDTAEYSASYLLLHGVAYDVNLGNITGADAHDRAKLALHILIYGFEE